MSTPEKKFENPYSRVLLWPLFCSGTALFLDSNLDIDTEQY